MRAYWFIFCYTLLFITIGWGFENISTRVHENVHVAIFNNYNISSTVKVNWLTGDGATYPNSSEYHLYCNEQCKYSHSLNEIVGYNVDKIAFSILLAVYLIGIVLILLIQLKKFDYEESLAITLDKMTDDIKELKGEDEDKDTSVFSEEDFK